MSDLVAIAYPDLATAQEVAGNVSRLQKSHELELDDMVLVERKANDKVKLHQPSATAAGAASGVLWGGLIGLLFLAPLVGMAIGAASGAAAGKLSDTGVDDNFLKELGAKMPAGGAALIALGRAGAPEKLIERLKPFGGHLIQSSLDDEAEERLRVALGEPAATT